MIKTETNWIRTELLMPLFDEKLTFKVSEWAEKNRILPPSVTSRPGIWRNDITPYLVDVMDCFSENSTIQKIAVMKGSQVGFTTGVIENAIGYIIDRIPGPMMFISGDQTVAEQIVETRIDKMLESTNLSQKIYAQTEKKYTRKTGDTKKKKEFPGGFLLAVGPNSATKLRATSVRYIFFDEIDAYPETSGKEGDPVTLAERRSDAFEIIRKLVYISTPLYEQTSKIKELYERGDQQKFYIPCIHCKEFQFLEWSNIKYEKDKKENIIFDSVYYECAYCKKGWKNSDKIQFLGKGEWRPTATAKEPNFKSYHLSSLYSPVGMRSWESIVQEWNNIGQDQQKLQVFVNTVLGEAWVERGQSPSFEKVLKRKDKYKRGTINENVLILTAGVDIQKDRLELEITGWGNKKESWSIDYKIIYSEFENVETFEDKCWNELHNVLSKEYLTKDSRKLLISVCFIDSSYATNTVYQFCERYRSGVYPIQGYTRNGPRKSKSIIRRDVSGYELSRYDVMVDIFKDEIAACLRKDPPAAGNKFPSGYCHFPKDYNETYFKQLTTEERFLKTDSKGNKFYVWENRKRRRNEAFDCRVYSLAALYLFFDLIAAEYEDEEMHWQKFWNILEEINQKD